MSMRPIKEQLTSGGRSISMNGILALVPTAQRLEVAAMLLQDEVGRMRDRSIAPPTSADDRRVIAMSDAIRAVSMLREQYGQIPGTGNVDGVSVRFALTPRQNDVLKLLLFGLPEKAIAEQLQLSRHTVHEHVKGIYRVLAVDSRPQLMARCLRISFGELPRMQRFTRRATRDREQTGTPLIAPSC
jgi:DNA-binding CsgD family transcriptional regulator